jgi:Kef-type K+ transport system membrane component KefB
MMLPSLLPPADFPTPQPTAGAAPLDVLFGLFMLLLAAKVGEEVARRLRQPAVVGELIGGVVVGSSVLGAVLPITVLGETAIVFAELGAVILLFTVGLEVRLDDLLAVGRPAVQTAVVAMVLPILAGVAVALLVGEEAGTAAFVGLALAATSIGITSRVLAEKKVLDRAFARVILGAAVVDDVAALILIGIVGGAATGDLSIFTFVLAASAVGLVLLGFAVARGARGLPREAFTWPLFADTPLVPAFLMMLAFALVSAVLGLAAIIGAFVAGLIIAETGAREELEHEMRPLGQIFVPFFFAVTGAQLDVSALLDAGVLAFALVLSALGVVTKALGGILGARRLGRWGSFTVGSGMVPRGEVGIVVANIGLAAGLLTDALFAAVLLAVVLTTIVGPYLLEISIPRALKERWESHHEGEPVPEPAD